MGLILCVFDLTNTKSFESLESWIFEMINGLHEDSQMILIGNKADLRKERAVTWECAKQFADSLGMLYLEASAKTGEGFQQALVVCTEQF